MAKRSLGLLFGAVLLCVAPISSANHREDARRESGAIQLPGLPGERPEAALRCGYLADARLGAGPLGHVAVLLDDEGDGTHRFALVDGQMGFFDGIIERADYDVAFYADLGSCGVGDPPVLARFDGPWNEEGAIPQGARYALITLGNEKIESAFEFFVS